MSRRWVIFLFAGLVALNYYPVFLGKVPLATDVIIQFPSFKQYQNESTLNSDHAEIGDPVVQFYPWRKQAGEAIRTGTLPLWNPDLLAGTPFQADPMAAVFYPLNWIFVVLPAPVAWSLSLMLKVFLAGVFTFLFLREIGASHSGSIVGGLAFSFGGFLTAWIGWTHSDTALWLPLICFFLHRLLRKPSLQTCIFLAAAATMPLLSGHPGVAAYVMVMAAAYGLWIVLWQRHRHYKQQLLWFMAAGGLALSLGAVQVLPTTEWLGQIERTLEMTWPSLPSSNALAFFSRDLSADPNSAGIRIPLGAAYAGALCLLAATLAPFHRNRRDVIFFGAVALIGLCSVYGVQPMDAIYDRMPVFKGVKKEEGLLLVDFSLAVLAALGVSLLEEFQWAECTTRKRVWLFGTVILATAAFHTGTAILSKMTTPGVDWWRSPRSFRVLLVVAAALILLRLLQVFSGRQWGVFAVAVAALDLLSFSHGYFPFNPPGLIFPKAAVFDFLSTQPKPFRVAPLNFAVMGNIEPIYGLSSASGYDFMHKRLALLITGMTLDRRDGVAFTSEGILGTRNRILDLLNVKYLIATPYNESLEQMRSEPNRFREIWSDGGVNVFENPYVLPRAFLVPQSNVETISSDAEQLARLREPDFDPLRAVILPAGFEQGSGKPGSNNHIFGSAAGVTKYEEDTNWVRIEAIAPTPSVLVLNQIYYPGWTVYVDGEETPVLRTNYVFTGTLVDTGIHKIEFRFAPRSFLVGAALSAASLLLLALTCVRQLRKGQQERLTTPAKAAFDNTGTC